MNANIQARSEERQLASQFADTRQTEIRDERRTAYAEFSTASYRSYGASTRALLAVEVRGLIPAKERLRVATEATDAFLEVDEAFTPVLFVAGSEVEIAASEYHESLRRLTVATSDALIKGNASASLAAMREESRRLARRYLSAVRLDLAIE